MVHPRALRTVIGIRNVFFILLEIKQRLRFNHCHLVRISRERMDVQFGLSCLEVNIAEWLQPADFQLGKFYEHASVSGESLKVYMALLIQTSVHLLDLKIGHVAYTSAQCALVSSGAAELKTLNQTSMRQHLVGSAYNFAQADIARKHTDNVSTPRNPDKCLVFLGF